MLEFLTHKELAVKFNSGCSVNSEWSTLQSKQKMHMHSTSKRLAVICVYVVHSIVVYAYYVYFRSYVFFTVNLTSAVEFDCLLCVKSYHSLYNHFFIKIIQHFSFPLSRRFREWHNFPWEQQQFKTIEWYESKFYDNRWTSYAMYKKIWALSKIFDAFPKVQVNLFWAHNACYESRSKKACKFFSGIYWKLLRIRDLRIFFVKVGFFWFNIFYLFFIRFDRYRWNYCNWCKRIWITHWLQNTISHSRHWIPLLKRSEIRPKFRNCAITSHQNTSPTSHQNTTGKCLWNQSREFKQFSWHTHKINTKQHPNLQWYRWQSPAN